MCQSHVAGQLRITRFGVAEHGRTLGGLLARKRARARRDCAELSETSDVFGTSSAFTGHSGDAGKTGEAGTVGRSSNWLGPVDRAAE